MTSIIQEHLDSINRIFDTSLRCGKTEFVSHPPDKQYKDYYLLIIHSDSKQDRINKDIIDMIEKLIDCSFDGFCFANGEIYFIMW